MLRTRDSLENDPPPAWPDANGILHALGEVPFGLVVLDRDQKILYASQLARLARVSRSGDPVEGRPFAEVYSGFSGPTASVASRDNRTGDFTWAPVPSGGWTGLFVIDRRPDTMPGVAQTDELTGLGNRAFLRTAAFAALNGAEANRPAILCLDLDRFKDVNDTLGHSAGDTLLQKVAERLRRIVRRTDMVIRVGGDEFTVLLPTLDTPEVADGIARRIIETVSRPYLLESRQVSIGVSIGIAHLERRENALEQAMRRADIALYAAKEGGRGQFRWFEEAMQHELEFRQTVINEIRKGLMLDQFEIRYQPQFSIPDGRICAVEALVRWNHPSRGELGPGAFLAIAEESGQINDLGAWVLSRACMTARDWPLEVPVCVNISASQFRCRSFLDTVRHALRVSELPSDRLELEMTGAVFIGDHTHAAYTIARLREMGVRVALDEFGSGYANFAQLRRIDLNRLKLAGSLLPADGDDAAGTQLLAAAASLGAALNVEVTAAGVERQSHMDSVSGTAATAVQGFLFAHPLTAAEVGDLIGTAARQISQPEGDTGEGHD